jgi:AGZA family xanthine/uracil permease-like MFS transporter
MPDAIVFGRILPATGLMLCLSTMYYAWLAYRLAKKTAPGTLMVNPPGSSPSVGGDEGCLVLAIYEKPVTF